MIELYAKDAYKICSLKCLTESSHLKNIFKLIFNTCNELKLHNARFCEYKFTDNEQEFQEVNYIIKYLEDLGYEIKYWQDGKSKSIDIKW